MSYDSEFPVYITVLSIDLLINKYLLNKLMRQRAMCILILGLNILQIFLVLKIFHFRIFSLIFLFIRNIRLLQTDF